MKIFIIGPVRKVTERQQREMDCYVAELESRGHTAHLPARDTKQDATGLEICQQNLWAIEDADEVHIRYAPTSRGVHFDIGMAFALHKTIQLMPGLVKIPVGKNFARMLQEWRDSQGH